MLSDNAMKFNSKSKLDLAAAAEAGRYAMHHVNLDVVTSELSATDGRILAVIPCEVEEGDSGGLIPRDAIKIARTGCKAEQATVKANGSVKAHGKAGIVEMTRPDGQFPRYADVIPPQCSDDLRIGLNAELLWKLVQALGESPEHGYGVELRIRRGAFTGNALTAPIGVRMLGAPPTGARGVIMPITVDY